MASRRHRPSVAPIGRIGDAAQGFPERIGSAAEAAKDTVPVAKYVRQVAPGRARPHDPQHALDKHPIVPARRALLIRPPDDQGRNPLPLRIAQHQTIQHAQDRLPKSSLESRPKAKGKPKSPQNLERRLTGHSFGRREERSSCRSPCRPALGPASGTPQQLRPEYRPPSHLP